MVQQDESLLGQCLHLTYVGGLTMLRFGEVIAEGTSSCHLGDMDFTLAADGILDGELLIAAACLENTSEDGIPSLRAGMLRLRHKLPAMRGLVVSNIAPDRAILLTKSKDKSDVLNGSQAQPLVLWG